MQVLLLLILFRRLNLVCYYFCFLWSDVTESISEVRMFISVAQNVVELNESVVSNKLNFVWLLDDH